MKITASQLIATYDYHVEYKTTSLNLRLEIHRQDDSFMGKVFRYDLYRIKPSFPVNQGTNHTQEADECILVLDDFFASNQLMGQSVDDVKSIFLQRLNHIIGGRE